MAKAIKNYAETTDLQPLADPISEAMGVMRIAGTVLINEDYVSPWAVSIPDAARLRDVLGMRGNVRVVAFHFVKRGQVQLKSKSGDTLLLETGEMALCFGGLAHHISQGSGSKVMPVESLLRGGLHPSAPAAGGTARGTSLMCGVFMLSNVELNPLFQSLPPMLHVSPHRGAPHLHVSELLDWMSREVHLRRPGGQFVIQRQLELLCAEVLRSRLQEATSVPGWFQALRDPVVGRAIAMIHAGPAQAWTVARLANGVAMSPSRFAARFAAALGESPMAYVTKWRMNLAGQLLSETGQGVGEVAAGLGYENIAAFTRAFKRHQGAPPATWRAMQRAV